MSSYETVMGGIGTAGIVTMWFMVVAGIGFLAWGIWYYLQFRVTVIVRPITDDRTIVQIDKARIIRQRGKPMRWKLWKRKDYIPVPPSRAIEVGSQGKLFVEVYFTQDGEYIFIEDKLDHKANIGSLNPIRNVDKEFYAQELEESKKYDNRKLSEILLQVAPVLAIIIIIALFLVFFADAVKPTIDFAESLVRSSEALTKALDSLNTCTTSITAGT